MFQGYRIVGVTPAGRKKYLKILLPYILKNKRFFDEYRLWLNTEDKNDVKYILSQKFKVVQSEVPLKKTVRFNIGGFFKDCIDRDTIYVRFDDDICWIEENCIEELLRFRIMNPEPFLVYCTTVNNRMNNDMSVFMDGYRGRHTAEQGKRRHELFLNEMIHRLDDYKFDKMDLRYGCNVNAISWFGYDFAKFGGIVPKEEEQFISETIPKKLKRKNVACGRAWVSHFSYKTQREELEATNLYDRYLHLSVS